jgi:hypothetical protein
MPHVVRLKEAQLGPDLDVHVRRIECASGDYFSLSCKPLCKILPFHVPGDSGGEFDQGRHENEGNRTHLEHLLPYGGYLSAAYPKKTGIESSENQYSFLFTEHEITTNLPSWKIAIF